MNQKTSELDSQSREAGTKANSAYSELKTLEALLPASDGFKSNLLEKL